MDSLSAADTYSKQLRRCTVGSTNGVRTTQVYYPPRPRSFSAGSQNTAVTASSKRLSAPISSSCASPSSNVKVMRINTKMYGKAKSLEESRKPLASPTAGGSSTMRYKTELCRPFQENGFCKYGDKCQFAHGEMDLRSLPRHPKYKTELCRTYHTRGFCPYGLRCHFIHNIDETRKSQETCRVLPPKSPTKRSFSFTMPLSPSLDSGISSPDDYQRGKYFEFPGTDHSSGSGSDGEFRDFEQSYDLEYSYVPVSYTPQENLTSPDPFLELDANSLSSNDSPSKPLPDEFQSEVCSVQDLLNHMTLEDSSPLGRTSRLPVFDDMLNTKSDSALLDSGHTHSAGYFGAA